MAGAEPGDIETACPRFRHRSLDAFGSLHPDTSARPTGPITAGRSKSTPRSHVGPASAPDGKYIANATGFLICLYP
jgi:hypothetical protein